MKSQPIKGNLSRSRGVILKIRAREMDGKIIHKGEFAVSDEKNVEKELRTWTDAFGVPLRVFKNIVDEPFNKDDYNLLKEKMEKDIRENTEKIKKALGVA